MATTNCVPFWALPPFALPSGGKYGQVLVKKSNTDFDAEWKDVEGVGSGLPDMTTETEGMFLTNSNGSPLWKAVEAGGTSLPEGTGILTSTYNKDTASYEYSWKEQIPLSYYRPVRFNFPDGTITLTPNLPSTLVTTDYKSINFTGAPLFARIGGYFNNGNVLYKEFCTMAVIDTFSPDILYGCPPVMMWQSEGSSDPCILHFNIQLVIGEGGTFTPYIGISVQNIKEGTTITFTNFICNICTYGGSSV